MFNGSDSEEDGSDGFDEPPQRHHGPTSIEWQEVSFSIGDKDILLNQEGIVVAGRLLGIMGPSGCGKTTLLNCISGRQKTSGWGKEYEGDVTVQGETINPVKYRSNISYVMQDDALIATETPRDCLQFAARTHPPFDKSDVRLQKVDTLLANLQLEDCADTKVGSATVKGISGGERKRTAIGVEFISEPQVLFADEPLSGLDSYNAYTLVKSLKSMSMSGIPVAMTIHQPSSEIVEMLDDVMILHKGETIYYGPRDKIDDYFEKFGFKCPKHHNIMDHAMFVIQTESDDQVDKLKQAWTSSPERQLLLGKIKKADVGGYVANDSDDEDDGHAASAPFRCCMRFGSLILRELRGMIRNPAMLIQSIFGSVFTTIIFAVIYWQAGVKEDSQDDVPNCLDPPNFSRLECQSKFSNHVGALIVMVTFATFTLMSLMTLFVEERPVFLREYTSGSYSVCSYFIAKAFVEIVNIVLAYGIGFYVGYFMIGLRGNFFLMLLMTYILDFSLSSIFLCLGAYIKDAKQANGMAGLVLMPIFLFSGFFPISAMPGWISWLRFISPLYYGADIVQILEFGYVKDNYDECMENVGGNETLAALACPGDVLRWQLTQTVNVIHFDNFWSDFAILILLLVVFRVLAIAILKMKGQHVYK